MSDAARLHEQPAAAPLADARKHIACARTALAAVAHHRPDLGELLGQAHALLADAARHLSSINTETTR